VSVTAPSFCFRGYAGAAVVGGPGILYTVSSCSSFGTSKWFSQGVGQVSSPLITVQEAAGATCFQLSPTTQLSSNPEVFQATITAKSCCRNEQVQVVVKTNGPTFGSTVGNVGFN
jgi:hypothetical protein